MSIINYWGRRIIAYPCVAFGYLLTMIARQFIVFGAWLVDQEALTKESE